MDAFNRNPSYRFLAADQTVGYSPADGTYVIREPGWKGTKITIRQGLRVNPNFVPKSAGGAILAVGGSLVFGDEVSDEETWPAILERRLNRRVFNGGVSGYGPALAVLRAKQLLKTQSYSLVILSVLITDLPRDRYVNLSCSYRPAIIREGGRIRPTTVEESGRTVSENFACAHPWIPELFFWSYIAKGFFFKLGYDGCCTNIIHPKAATPDEVLEFAIEQVAALPVNKIILIQYPRFRYPPYSFEGVGFDGARKIRDAASRHGVGVIDTYNAFKDTPLLEILKSGNEVVSDLIAPEIAAIAP